MVTQQHNNSLEGPGMQRQEQEELELRVPNIGCEEAIPGRSLA